MAEDAALFNQLFNSWTWQQGDDQSGFFDGVPAESILSKVTSGNIRPVIFDFLHPNAGANAAIVPYEHLDLKDTTLETLFRSHPVPTLHDTNFGDLLLTMQHPLVVSIPIYPSEFIFVKIDILVCIHEHKFTNGSLFCETMLTGPLTQVDLDKVRNIAVDIIKAAAASGAQISQDIKDIIITDSSTWRIVINEHVIVK